MHLAVIYEHTDVAGVRSGKRSFYHSFLDTLEDGRHEAEIDGTTDHAVVEFQFTAPFKFGNVLGLDVQLGLFAVNHEFGIQFAFGRADKEVDLTELTGAAGLLFMTVLCACHLGDSFAVRYLWSIKFDIEFEFVVQAPLDEIDMLLALAAENSLTEFFGVLYDSGRILRCNLVESVAHFGLIVLVGRLDGATVLGFRELDVLVSLASRFGQSDVGLSGFQFHNASDIACAKHGNLFLLGSGHRINSGKTLAVAVLRVGEVGAFLEHTAHYLEVGDIAKVLLDAGLENEYAARSGLFANNLFAGDGLVDTTLRAGRCLDAELHKPSGTDVLLC